MNEYLVVKTLHILSSAILFGTGLGIAFFMLRSQVTPSLEGRYFAIRTTVLADCLFTLPAIIIQPLTGAWLVHRAGINWLDHWLVATLALYCVVVVCWIPVVWIQIRLKQILAISKSNNAELPEAYHRLFRAWILLGIPAFLSLLAIFFLMVAKPQ